MEWQYFPKIAIALVSACLAVNSGASAMAAPSSGAMLTAQTEKAAGQGKVNAIDAAKRKLNITHGPIAALNWPAMTMDFGVIPGVDLSALKPGSKISFTLIRGADGMFVIDQINAPD